jgi:metal-dependent hydrolase (beta-lactamase superfamily II)
VKKTTFVICGALVVLAGALQIPPSAQTQGGQTQDVRALLQAVSKNIGADNLTTLEYGGAGMVAAPGQGYDPIPTLIGIPESWPRFAVTNYTMTIDYTTMSSREAYTRTSPEPPNRYPALPGPAREHGNLSDPSFRRGGGGIANPAPVQVDLRNNKNVAWDVVNNKPLRQWQYLYGIDAGEYRQLEIILTPHGFVKAALAQGANPILVPGGGPRRVVLNNVLGKYKVIGTLEDNLVAMVETFIPNPVVGDMRINHEYDEWRDFGGVKMWTEDHSHFVEAYQADNRQFRITGAQANVKVAPETFAVPQDVAQATRPAVRVESRQLAPGVWFLGGGSHNSVLVEFRDFVTVVEAPQNDERSQAVVAEVRRLVPNKPIRYVVNTHAHWDHAGGLRGLVAAGAQIVTHQRNAEYYGRVMFGRERKLMPDSLSQREELLGVLTNPQFVQIGNQGFIHDRRPLTTEVSKVIEFFNIGTGSPPYSNHNEFFLVAYLPAEGILINADLYSPPAAGAALPSPAPEGVVAIGHIIKEFNLKVTQHVPIHGQPGSHEQFMKILGSADLPDAHGPLVAPNTTTSSR